jgi:ribonucleoside-diphosphate reductase alpha chain
MTEVILGSLAEAVYKQKYSLDGKEEWPDTAKRVVDAVMRPILPELADETEQLIRERKFIPGGRYLYASGRRMNQVNNCLLLKVEDSREGWASLMRRVTEGLMTGAGIGVDYSALRHNGAPILGTGGESTGPLALMQMVNEAGRHIRQGGSRRSALWAGLNWRHKDIFAFINMKNWSDDIKAAKEKDFNSPAPMDGTNISVLLDDAFFEAYWDYDHPEHNHARRVYDDTIDNMLLTGEPGFSVDVGVNAGETLRNACTELTSSDDNDICNLGSLNMARIENRGEFGRAVELATAFLLCGTLYSKVPFDEVAVTRDKNRRLGLGLMGLAEWLAVRDYTYQPNDELRSWLEYYELSGLYANKYADELGISRPVKTRAIAPAGTISIVAETTSGMEPIFAAAYKRRYLKGDTWHAQYTIDASAERLAAKGVDPDMLETAATLAATPHRRVAMQAFLQKYVDHGISSTINLPSFAEQSFSPREFGQMLIQYLPKVRGITAYPDGSRGGQPLNAVSYAEAKEKEGVEVVETGNEEACKDGVCGI